MNITATRSNIVKEGNVWKNCLGESGALGNSILTLLIKASSSCPPSLLFLASFHLFTSFFLLASCLPSLLFLACFHLFTSFFLLTSCPPYLLFLACFHLFTSFFLLTSCPPSLLFLASFHLFTSFFLLTSFLMLSPVTLIVITHYSS
jgi:hypothetical protein